MDRQIQALTARVERLEREFAKNSRNPSRPPSSDPPSARKRKRARPKGSSGQGQGAQPGHEGKGRELLPTWACDEVVVHWPARCRCGHAFAEAERAAAFQHTGDRRQLRRVIRGLQRRLKPVLRTSSGKKPREWCVS